MCKSTISNHLWNSIAIRDMHEQLWKASPPPSVEEELPARLFARCASKICSTRSRSRASFTTFAGILSFDEANILSNTLHPISLGFFFYISHYFILIMSFTDLIAPFPCFNCHLFRLVSTKSTSHSLLYI